MLLKEYKIKGRGDNKQISFNDPALKNLEDILNSDWCSVLSAEGALLDLNDILSNWNDIENFSENNYNGFWDVYTLNEVGDTGTCFSYAGFVDFTTYIKIDNSYVYIKNKLIPANPRVGMPITELIDILEQWKEL